MQAIQSVCLLLLLSQLTDATFSKGFQNFLTYYYGQAVAQNLTRLDLGADGSFGGGSSSLYLSLKRDPVVVVHGLNTAAGGMKNVSDFFIKYGYTQGSLFATTYGPNGTVIGGGDTVTCAYLKQVRQLVIAVNKYTGRRVVVAGYSLGAAVSRKMILGGVCLDNNQTLGNPLTSLVSAFFSIAGANQGATLCQQLPTAPMCNNVTGFSTGSQFLKDINRKQGYESGQSIFMLGSVSDEVVGFSNQALPGADVNITLNGFLHVPECFNTLHIQYELITNGYLTQSTINIDAAAESALTGTNCTGSVKQAPRRWNYNNPCNFKDWYKQATGDRDSSSNVGSYDSKGKRYVFNSGYFYYLHKKLQNSQFLSNKPVF
ncbi:LIPaSe related [Aphelenchoides bicaudatus]|nr:LIPaSe related [Aphelenchoides bicaudatus]